MTGASAAAIEAAAAGVDSSTLAAALADELAAQGIAVEITGAGLSVPADPGWGS